mmetsp:Transcript_6945/g.15706  ORF Transcript_6945/g.15706 Transcript_6945/m.15706 type:complete len:226 (-) Transcript_6945:7-684(-)
MCIKQNTIPNCHCAIKSTRVDLIGIGESYSASCQRIMECQLTIRIHRAARLNNGCGDSPVAKSGGTVLNDCRGEHHFPVRWRAPRHPNNNFRPPAGMRHTLIDNVLPGTVWDSVSPCGAVQDKSFKFLANTREDGDGVILARVILAHLLIPIKQNNTIRAMLSGELRALYRRPRRARASHRSVCRRDMTSDTSCVHRRQCQGQQHTTPHGELQFQLGICCGGNCA